LKSSKFIKILLALLLVHGCITWSVNEPDEPGTKKEKKKFKELHFTIVPLNKVIQVNLKERMAFTKAFEESGVFDSVVYHESLERYAVIEKGTAPIFLEIKSSEVPYGPLPTSLLIINSIVSGATLTIWPWYYPSRITREMILYSYNEKNKAYEKTATKSYTPTTHIFFGWIAIPFLWINLFTNGQEDVTRLVALDYIKNIEISSKNIK